jgi:hypothetical protein
MLPKNPRVADFLLAAALKRKYQENIHLNKLDDELEIKAHSVIVRRLKIRV